MSTVPGTEALEEPTVEVAGAEEEPLAVYSKCRKKVMDLMVKRFPGLMRYIGSDSLLYFQLLKALYGCV